MNMVRRKSKIAIRRISFLQRSSSPSAPATPSPSPEEKWSRI